MSWADSRILASKLLVVFTLILMFVVVFYAGDALLSSEGFHDDHAPGVSSETLETRVAQLEQTVDEQQTVISRITGFMVDLSNDYVLLERRVEVLENGR